MDNPSQIQVIVTGTGQAGTALLARLVTELGLGTDPARGNWRIEFFEHGAGGLEKRILAPISSAEGQGPFGQFRPTAATEQQQFDLARAFHDQLHTLVRCEIPFALIEFPRFAEDPRYAFERLEAVLEGRSWEQFADAFHRVVERSIIPAAAGQFATIARGTPALAMAVGQRLRRRRQWQRVAVAALLAAMLGIGAYRLSPSPMPSVSTLRSSAVQDGAATATNPEAASDEGVSD